MLSLISIEACKEIKARRQTSQHSDVHVLHNESRLFKDAFPRDSSIDPAESFLHATVKIMRVVHLDADMNFRSEHLIALRPWLQTLSNELAC